MLKNSSRRIFCTCKLFKATGRQAPVNKPSEGNRQKASVLNVLIIAKIANMRTFPHAQSSKEVQYSNAALIVGFVVTVTTARHYNKTVLLYASLYYFDILFDHHQSVRSGDQKIYHHSVSHKKKQVVKTKTKKNDCKTIKQDKDKKRKNQPWVTQSHLYHHLRL